MEALDVADEEAARVAAARAEMIASAQLARAAAADKKKKKEKETSEAVGSKRRNKSAADDDNDDDNEGGIEIDENKIPPNPLLEGMGVSDYVLRAVKQTRHTDVENALLVLPFVYVVKLLEFLHRWISERKEIELCCRCLLFLLKTHHNQITAQATLLPLLSASGEKVHAQLQGLHSRIGVNMTALSMLKRDLQETMNVAFYDADERIKARLRQTTAKTTKKKVKV
jgi:U3 small nucleolar RNA-associated protein 12